MFAKILDIFDFLLLSDLKLRDLPNFQFYKLIMT